VVTNRSPLLGERARLLLDLHESERGTFQKSPMAIPTEKVAGKFR
jgi:hypothetical protein